MNDVEPDDGDWLDAEALAAILLGHSAGIKWNRRRDAETDTLAIRLGFDEFQVSRRSLRADALRGTLGTMCEKWGRWLYELVDVAPYSFVREDALVAYFVVPLARGETRPLRLPRIAAEIRKWAEPVRGHTAIAAARVVQRWDDEYAVVTEGSAFNYVVALEGVDTSRTWSSVPYEMECALGVLGGKASLAAELAAASDMPAEHIELIAAFVTRTGAMVGFTWNDAHKIRDDIWSVAVFERPIDVFAAAALYGAVDDNKSVNASVIKGDVPRMGTGAVDICINFGERNAAGGAFATLPDATYGVGGGGGFMPPLPAAQQPPPPPPPQPPQQQRDRS